MRLRLFYLSLFLLVLTHNFSQAELKNLDLNQFTVLQCAGEIPEDFLLLSSEKYASEKKKNDAKDKNEKEVKNEFYKKSSFQIDDLLLSGDVLFGDPVTNYINKVADNLLKGEPKLRKRLRFYTIKSNVTNAFSSDPGIIFVSTGLISQLENEAQIAFILSHEIAHFTENHAIDNYVEEKRIKGEIKNEDDQIKKFSQYSKKNELEADRLGALRIFEHTDYSPSEIMTTFDILQFSNLPFDDIEVKKDFYNRSGVYVPPNFFSDSIPAISLEVDLEKYENSTHPNVNKRREKVDELFESLEDTRKYFIVYKKEEFEKVRDLCRFQNVFNNISNLNYEEALYDIYMLLQKYPNNKYLNASECKALVGYAIYIIKNERSEVRTVISDVEGESFRMFKFFRDLSDEQFITLIAKICYSNATKYPSDPLFDRMTTLAFRIWNQFEGLELYEYGYMEIDSIISNKENQDSVKNNDYIPESSKYDKIRNLETKSGIDKDQLESKYHASVAAFTPSNFHKYIFHENLEDPLFKKYKKSSTDFVEAHDIKYIPGYNPIFQPREYKTNFFATDTIVIINPKLIRWSEKNGGEYFYSEQQLAKYLEIIQNNAKRLDLEIELLALKSLGKTDVDKFNAVAAYKDYSEELMIHESDIQLTYCSQLELLLKYNEKFGTSKILIPSIYSVRTKERFGKMLYMLTGVLIPVVLIDLMIPDDFTLMYNIFLDAKNNELLIEDMRYFKKKPSASIIRLHSYDLLHQIKTKPKN